MTPLEDAEVQDGAISIHEAEFAVQSSIAVREEHKSRLQALLEGVALQQSSRGVSRAIANTQPDLRCANASRHILPIESADDEDECEVCDRQTSLSLHREVHCSEEETTADASHNGCPSCCAIQDARLLSVRKLVTASHDSLVAAQIDYHGHCQHCGSLVEPILVVLSCFTTAAVAGLIQLLSHHFSCFDMAAVDGGRSVTIADFRHAIEVERIVVLFNADCGATTAAASEFTHELHSQLYPEHHELQQSFHVVFVVDNRTFASQQGQIGSTAGSRDQDVLEALEALTSAACHVGDQEPIRENDDAESGAFEDALSFEAYLVSEALLVEATRVMLRPEVSWRKPGETVGASSWSTACEFLSDPRALSLKLQLVRPSSFPQSATQETLDACVAHPKWPQRHEDVRPIFRGLLCFMLHVSHARHVLQARGGILQDSSNNATEIGFLTARETGTASA